MSTSTTTTTTTGEISARKFSKTDREMERQRCCAAMLAHFIVPGGAKAAVKDGGELKSGMRGMAKPISQASGFR